MKFLRVKLATDFVTDVTDGCAPIRYTRSGYAEGNPLPIVFVARRGGERIVRSNRRRIPMFTADTLTFQEFAMQEPLPLAAIQNAVLEFLRGRDDVAVFGAHAVNIYVAEPRMTQTIDLISPRAVEFVEELRENLSQRFHVALRVREIGDGRGYRLYQIQKSGNRHLVDVRPVKELPATQRIDGVLAIAPADLIANKVVAYHQRRGQPKSGTDWRDLAMLLLAFPDLKRDPGLVTDRLKAASVESAVLEVWQELAAQEIQPAGEDDEFE